MMLHLFNYSFRKNMFIIIFIRCFLLLLFVYLDDFIICDKIVSSADDLKSSTVAVDISSEYNFFVCSDNLQKPDANLELRTSNNFESLQLYQFGKIWPLSNRSFPINVACTLHLSACSSCVVQLSWNNGQNKITLDPSKSSAMRQTCEKPWDFKDSTCFGANLVEENADRLSYKPYRRFSMMNNTRINNFTSTSYKVEIYLYSWKASLDDSLQMSQIFPIDFKVIDNSVTKRGKPAIDLIKDSEGFIESPRFPKTYPEGITVNYTLINEESNGFVRLIFYDFQLHYMSSLEIIDSNGNTLKTATSSYGTSGRPCAIQSSGPSLTLVFTANHYTHEVGFRAQYKFVKDDFWPDKPSCKTCDKLFDDKGGVISVESLELDVNTYVDCIWTIAKSRFAQPLYDKLYVKVEDFSVGTAGRGIQLEIFDGQTSLSRKLLSIFGPRTKEQLARDQPQEGFVADLSDMESVSDLEDRGFYIRLKGYLGSYAGLSITFAQFYRWATAMCHDATEFHCENGRCILGRYRCDGHDHCGDYSDEMKERCQDKKPTNNWDNGYNPKPGPPISYDEANNIADNRFPFNYTTTILLVAGLIGLTLVMLMVTVIVARVYRQRLIRRLTAQRRSQSLSSNHASFANPHADDHTGSRPGPSIHQVGNRRLLVLPESDIGVFEAPPTYDDALKHPSVPPDRRSVLALDSQLQMSTTGAANPAFLDDTGRVPQIELLETAPGPVEDEPSVPPPPRLRLGSTSSSDTCGSSSLPRSPVGSQSSVSSLGTVEPDAEVSDQQSAAVAEGRGRLNGILNWARTRIRRSSSPEEIPVENNSAAIEQPSTFCESQIAASVSPIRSTSGVSPSRTPRVVAPVDQSPIVQNSHNEVLEMRGTLV